MKYLAFISLFVSVSALAQLNPHFRQISCMAPGEKGFFMTGAVFTQNYFTYPHGGVELISTSIEAEEFTFLDKGVRGSTIRNISAYIKDGKDIGDGMNLVKTTFNKTSSPRIRKMVLVLTQESNPQAKSYVITSKGNKYWSACTFNGASGI